MIVVYSGLQKIMISIPSLPKHDPPKEILDSMIHDLSHLISPYFCPISFRISGRIAFYIFVINI